MGQKTAANDLEQTSTLIEAPSTITKYSTLPGSTEIVYSTIKSAYTSTVISVHPGRTIYETSVSTEEGATVTSCSLPIGPVSQPITSTVTQTLPGATYTSFFTATPSCSTPVGPESPPATITHTRTLPGLTLTSVFTAPGFNHSSVYTSFVTRPGPTFVTTALGPKTTITEFETKTLPGATITAPGGSLTYTHYSTKTLPGATVTSIVFQPGENGTVTSTETTTCFETVSATCSASPTAPALPPRETTIYATNYFTKTIPTTYTADATCTDKTVTITASSGTWDKPGSYGSQTWDDKPSGYGGAATTSGGSWKRA